MAPEEDLPTIKPNLDDFYEAWTWLCDHPYFFFNGLHAGDNEPGFTETLYIAATKGSEQTEIWLEVGPFVPDEGEQAHPWHGVPSHDPDLDVGGATFEIAICALARKVLELHGDYPEYQNCSHCLKRKPAGPTDIDDVWFCSDSCAACGDAGFRTEPVEGRTDVVRYVPPREYFDCEHWRK